MSDQARSAETVKPVFVDNRDGNTLAREITTHLAALRQEGRTPAELCVASCYFNPQGLELIASEPKHVPRIRLLLGADPRPEALLPRRAPHVPPNSETAPGRALEDLARHASGASGVCLQRLPCGAWRQACQRPASRIESYQ